MKGILAGVILLILSNLTLAADPQPSVHIAVASNFVFTLKQLTQQFEKQTGIEAIISAGATGKLYAQIIHGAPYDVFLSADVLRAEMLEQQNIATSGSRFTYAIGKLVVWHPQFERFSLTDISSSDVKRIAIANPRLAPYGLAAMQTMKNLGLWEIVQTKLVRGENINQALQFAQSGNVEAAFVSNAAMVALRQNRYLNVPQRLYEPIAQQAVQLHDTQSAQAFLAYLRTSSAKLIIENNGYLTH